MTKTPISVSSRDMRKRPNKTKTRELIDKAAAMFGGSDTKLAEACGCTQNAIWQARARGAISAELAAAIHRATTGDVPATETRPDLWPLHPAVEMENAVPA